MPQHHTTADQVVFVGEWFSGWSELQRSDFLPSLMRELHPAHHINGGLPEHLSALSLGSNRPPSIFHCQVKLFHDWVSGWSSEERAKLVGLLKAADPSFGEKIDKAGAALEGGHQQPLEQQQQQVEQPQQPSLAGSNGNQQRHDLEQQQQLPPLLQNAAAAVQLEQQQLVPEAQGQLLEQQVQPPAPAVAAVVAPQVAGAGAPESDVDEALDSSPSSTLSSPRPSEQHADSGLDSPVGGEAAEVGDDEGGHVVVMDDDAAPAAGDVAVAVGNEGVAEEGGGDGME